ncbi:GAF domain-containing protein [Thermomonospora cellulosilytica]|uniref:GAF domain-containing protein n=1 Tax=Thermomonospora cellulosilytica TaxID=1411118 RepID=A0A7W3MVT8_9ACTN|nr:GAF domain-containing protein [Thermomonospora cellulosilytica]MBA9002829.1 GAF domain-containing protein [Thermomonospora cellulosilytica]
MTFVADSGLHLPEPDDQRDQRLWLLNDLGLGDADAEFDAFATDLARAFAAGLARDAEAPSEPYAMVNLITDEQVFAGLHNPAGGDLPTVGRTMPRDHGYCPEVVDRRKALVLPDVFAAPRFASNPVVDQIGIRTYAGAPLIHQPTGTVLGTVCVVGTTALPRSTGKASLALIKARRDALMDRIYQRLRHRPQ